MKWVCTSSVVHYMKLAAVRNFLKDESVAKWRKLLLFGAIAYAVFPLDAIPDTIPVIGWLDDVGILSLAAMAIWGDVKRHARALEIPSAG
jgi:uncharacterized membrane protein YkvA (DUF1232 family)